MEEQYLWTGEHALYWGSSKSSAYLVFLKVKIKTSLIIL